MVTKKILYLATAFLMFADMQSQDPAFNNTHQSLVYLNPSFSGSNGYLRNQTEYRNQWPNLSGSYVYYNTSFDGFIKTINAGVSFGAYTNNIGKGIIKQRRLSAAYAQYFSLLNNKIKIIPSLQLNYGLNTLDRSKLSLGGTSYPAFGLPANWTTTPSELITFFDMAAGLLIKYNSSYFGVSVSNILQPNISFAGKYNVPVKILIHASTNWQMDQSTNANVFGALTTQNNYYMANIRILNTFSNAFLYGAGYKFIYDNNVYSYEINRSVHNAIFYIGLRRKAITFQYSYDIYIAKNYGYPAGSHELSISLSLKRKDGEKPYVDLENK